MYRNKTILTSLFILFFYLLSYGQNQSILIDLIDNKEYEKAKELIKKKKFLNKRDKDKATPFMYAVYNNQLDIAKLLKKNGAKVKLKGLIEDYDEGLLIGSPLAAAALYGDIEMIKFLVLNCGIPANDKEIGRDGKEGWNALYYLSYRDDFNKIADFLIQKGADSNPKDLDGRTPLSYAFFNENTKYVNYLLKKKATSPYIDDIGLSPASFMIFCNQSEAAKTELKNQPNLINQDTKPLANPLVAAFIQEDETMIKWLIDNNADKSIPLKYIDVIFEEAEYRESYGTYKLLSTYLLNDKLANKELISSKKLKEIILKTQKIEVFKMLINNDFDLNQSAQELCLSNGYYGIAQRNKKLKFLEENKISIRADTITNKFFRNSFANTWFNVKLFNQITKGLQKDNPIYNELLEYAIEYNNVSAFNLIVDKNIDLNVKLHNNSSFLWIAYENNNFHLFEKLIERGANTEFKYKDEKTILHRIVERSRSRKDKGILLTLLEKGANVNAQDSDGNTALHLSDHSYDDKLLITFGANINLKNKKNKSPSDGLDYYNYDFFDYAESKKNQDDLFVACLNDFLSSSINIRNFDYALKYLLNKGVDLKDPNTIKKINNSLISLAQSSEYFNHFNKIIQILETHDPSYKAPNLDEILINKLTKLFKVPEAITEIILTDNISDFKEVLTKYDLNIPQHHNDTFLVFLTIAAQADSKKIVQYILEQGISPLNRKIVPYSASTHHKIDVFKTLVDKKNIQAVNYILDHEGETNSFDFIDNYMILCELKDEALVKKYIDNRLLKVPNPTRDFLENDKIIYNLNLGAVKNNLLGVVKYLSEKGMPVSRSIEPKNSIVRTGKNHKLNFNLIIEEKINFIKYYLQNASEYQINNLIGDQLRPIIKTNRMKLVDLFIPYIIKNEGLLKQYYLASITYDNVYAMDAMLKIHPKEKTSLLVYHLKHAIDEINYNFISSYYSHGFDMSIKLYERGPNHGGIGDQGMIEYAIDNDVPIMINFLFDCDVPLFDPGNNDDSPIEYAVNTYDSNLIKFLLNNANINPNIINNYYSQPWAHILLNKGFFSGFEEFWKKGVNPNISDVEGNNLLHSMVYNGYDFTSKTSDILDKISNIDQKNVNGETALIIACKSGDLKCVEALLSKNANVNIGNNNRVTPLMIAAYSNNISLVKILLKAKVDVEKKDDKERNALDYAIMGNATEVISLIKN